MTDKPPFCWCHDDTIPDEVFESAEPDAASKPQEGDTSVMSWDELLYEMTNGAMGTPPPATPRRYEPPPQQRKKR